MSLELTDMEKIIVRAAANRIRDPKRWTRYALAHDSVGLPCSYRSARAVQFCAEGTIRLEASKFGFPLTEEFWCRLAWFCGASRNLQMVNDSLDRRGAHTAVLSILDKAGA